jgi:hypothetical protein
VGTLQCLQPKLVAISCTSACVYHACAPAKNDTLPMSHWASWTGPTGWTASGLASETRWSHHCDLDRRVRDTMIASAIPVAVFAAIMGHTCALGGICFATITRRS